MAHASALFGGEVEPLTMKAATNRGAQGVGCREKELQEEE
jgi:hypothetical protein